MTVLFVDNYDSFTYNLVEYVSQHGIDTTVLKNTATLDEVRGADPAGIVVSPGPGHPANDRDVGISRDVFREVSPAVPTLGVCLGLEAAVYEYGGTVVRATRPVHGKASPVDHDGQGVFRGLDQGFQAGRYHSLVATDVPDCFDVTATTTEVDDGVTDRVHGDKRPVQADDDARPARADEERRADGVDGGDGRTELVMGVRHREYPIECVQFHPESVLTGAGHDVVDNFLAAL